MKPQQDTHRNEAVIGPYSVSNAQSTSSAHTYFSGCQESDRTVTAPKKIKIANISEDEMEMEFDMIGTCAAIANCMRRTMMEDVCTVAIDLVDFHINTSVLQDENLAHRLGLVPLRCANNSKDLAVLLEYPEAVKWYEDSNCSLKFRLSVEGKTLNEPVYSGALQWVPLNEAQAKLFENCQPRPVHDDILLVKLKPGQVIVADIYACKGSGRIHTKFSPVAPVSYRMHPKVELCDPSGMHPTSVTDAEAQAIKNLCAQNVFDIEEGKLIVNNSRCRACTMCRECIREGNRMEKIRLSRVKDYFIFTVESTGSLKAPEIVQQALVGFEEKCRVLAEMVQNVYMSGGNNDGDQGNQT